VSDEPRAKAVIDGEIQHVSPSQIQTFDVETFGGCERKWYYDKVVGLDSPTTKNQALGTAIHAEIENYLETGVDSLGPLARSGKHFMPEPRLYLLVEHDAKGLVAAGVPVKMRIDCINYSGTYKDNEGVTRDDPGTVEVVDWKSTSSLEYAKGVAELLDSVQMISYGEWARRIKWDIESDLVRVRLSHGVICTTSRAARKTTGAIGVDDVARKWEGVERKVARMKDVARASKAEDVEPNRRACDAYRGCQFRAVCPRSPGEALFSIGGKTGMSLLNRLKTPTPTAPAPSSPVVPDPVALAAEIAKLEAEERAAKAGLCGLCGDPTCPKPNPGSRAAAQCPASAEERAAKAGTTTAETNPPYAAARAVLAAGGTVTEAVAAACDPKLVRAVGVVPADAVVSTPQNAAEPIPPEQLMTMSPAIQEVAKAFAAEGASVEVVTPELKDGEGSTGGAIVVKPKRGRPPKAKADAPASPPTAAPAPAEVVVNTTPGVIMLDMTALDLYVDVIVDGSKSPATRSLEPYIVQRCEEVARNFDAADIRCGTKDSPLGYGGWKGVLAAVVRARPPEPGAYTVTDVRESEIRQVVVEALRPLASTFVRGR
jgi:CRISPR/Cas system-associated exonuclease Cas4 (RecB family)